MCDNMFSLTEIGILKDMATFQALQTWIGHNTTRYHTPYRTFSLSLVWFGGYLQRVTTRYRQFF